MEKLMLFINSKFQAFTQHFFHKSQSTLQKLQHHFLNFSGGESEAQTQETAAHGLSSRIVTDPGTKADVLCHSPMLILCFVRLSLYIFK